ncbi:MAG: transketolase, partial [Solirubrobacterales bacterium]|nr:transketolase [Solirubrobacterales bacterium]
MTDDTEQLCIDTIRALAMDAIQKANSGHPGLPMAMAPAAYVLFRKVMRHDPRDPDWPDRDRFVLSAGHGSMLLYAVLHLTGYDVPMEHIKRFRQWESITPGHPELDRTNVTPGVELTTGPLGQGFANGVGMALAERFLRERYGAEVQDHRVYAIVSDGDLMEGIASEAASLAGQLGLGRIVYLYDDNDISLDGPTSLSFDREDVDKRFEAYGWHVSDVRDANDMVALETAIKNAQKVENKPSLIRVKSVIGYPAPNKSGTSKAHGAALGEDEVRLTKEIMGWDPDKQFHIPDEAYAAASMKEDGAAAHAEWTERFDAWGEANPELAEEWDLAWQGKALPGLADVLQKIEWDKDKVATRSAGAQIMAAFEPLTPTMLGGAADLSESTKTEFPESERYTAEKAGRNVFFGVREHGMGGAVNGMAAHGGIVRPYGATFMQFADYMRGAIRLSALTGLPCTWVFTHDSVGLGEDGPTHQPVEHLAALRAIPGLVVLRPADAHETAEAWRVMIEDLEGPAALVLSRQDLPVLDRDEYGSADGVGKGAYVLSDADDPEAIIIATGSEVWVALAAAEELDVQVRVVSMPSWELFEQQEEDYKTSVLPVDLPTVSVEAGV